MRTDRWTWRARVRISDFRFWILEGDRLDWILALGFNVLIVLAMWAAGW